jgi:hypothetical protein
MILWSVSLLGGGGLAWWISTRDWPAWAQYVLVFAITADFIVGGPFTYREYLRDAERQADYADLLTGRGGVLGECRNCGRHTYAEDPTCVRCGIHSPIPGAAGMIKNVRFLIGLGYAVMASTAITVIYLLTRALLNTVG